MGLIHVKPRRWSVDEYQRMSEQRVFPAGERTELLEGEIISRDTPMKSPHVAGIVLGTDVFMTTMRDTHFVAVQVTMKLTPWSAPDPDFVLVSRAVGQPGQLLTTGDLVVEVADSSLDVDRHEKASLYAWVGIPEYWIVNLVDRQVEVHREPGPAAHAPYQAAYGRVTVHRGSTLTPLCRPDLSLPVAGFLPPPEVPEQP